MPEFATDGQRAYDLLRRLGPARMGGSEQEAAAAGVLVQEVRGLGLDAAEETLAVQTASDLSARLAVLEPFQAEIPCEAIGLSGQTSGDGLEAPLVYAESGGAAYLAGTAGQIPLIFGRLNAIKYENLALENAAGFVCIGKPGTGPTLNMLEATWIERWGKRPGAFVSFDDGLRLVRQAAGRVRLTVQQHEYEGESRNVVVEIPGSRRPQEVILIGAHMDSHRQMDGAHDNGAGTVVAMELLRHFAAHPPARTLRFVWFGSEELGCRGSRAYVERHAGELEAIVFMLNLDLGGGILGQDAVDVMGPPELRAHFDLLDKERGLGLQIREKVYGGDNIPFVGEGIPAATIYRSDGTCYYIHTPDDRLDMVDGHHLAMLAGQAGAFLDRIANAYHFPFPRLVPEAIRKEYLRLQVEYMGVDLTAEKGQGSRS